MAYAELAINTAPDMTLPVLALTLFVSVSLAYVFRKTRKTVTLED